MASAFFQGHILDWKWEFGDQGRQSETAAVPFFRAAIMGVERRDRRAK